MPREQIVFGKGSAMLHRRVGYALFLAAVLLVGCDTTTPTRPNAPTIEAPAPAGTPIGTPPSYPAPAGMPSATAIPAGYPAPTP